MTLKKIILSILFVINFFSLINTSHQEKTTTYTDLHPLHPNSKAVTVNNENFITIIPNPDITIITYCYLPSIQKIFVLLNPNNNSLSKNTPFAYLATFITPKKNKDTYYLDPKKILISSNRYTITEFYNTKNQKKPTITLTEKDKNLIIRAEFNDPATYQEIIIPY